MLKDVVFQKKPQYQSLFKLKNEKTFYGKKQFN